MLLTSPPTTPPPPPPPPLPSPLFVLLPGLVIVAEFATTFVLSTLAMDFFSSSTSTSELIPVDVLDPRGSLPPPGC